MSELEEIREGLEKPFDPSMVSWTPTYVDTNRMFAYVYPNIDRYAVIQRLNDVVGWSNWEHDLVSQQFKNGEPLPAFTSKLTLHVGERSITKEDGAGIRSGRDSVKSGITNALKRVADLFGIGLYLRNEDAYYVDLFEDRNEGERTLVNDGTTYSFDPPYDQCTDTFFPSDWEQNSSSKTNKKQPKKKQTNKKSSSKKQSGKGSFSNDMKALDSDGNLTFGKYQGKPMSDVEDWYIDSMLGYSESYDGFDEGSNQYEVFHQEKVNRLKEMWKDCLEMGGDIDMESHNLMETIQNEYGVEEVPEMSLADMQEFSSFLEDVVAGKVDPNYTPDGGLIMQETAEEKAGDFSDVEDFFE